MCMLEVKGKWDAVHFLPNSYIFINIEFVSKVQVYMLVYLKKKNKPEKIYVIKPTQW